MHKLLSLTAGLVVACCLGACAHPGPGPASSAASHAIMPVWSRADVLWLDRVTFGADETTLAQFKALGRAKFLESQLHPDGEALPDDVTRIIATLSVSQGDVRQRVIALHALRRDDNRLLSGEQRDEARRRLNEQGNALARDALRRDLLRAVYAPAQLQEQMVWFWLNHFNVFQGKGNLRWWVGDYEESAIRPHVFGHFKELVMATLEHPAMLEYLDNDRNAAGHINENYARELLELHTLGVDSGYTQGDVQNLARVLTGVGVADGAFRFFPRRHDTGPKVLFGREVSGQGFGEVEAAVGAIVNQPACARYISRELAAYFVADVPPPALVERMAQTFRSTDGDIAAVLRTMFLSRELDASLGGKFKDPMRFVVSAVRLGMSGERTAGAGVVSQAGAFSQGMTRASAAGQGAAGDGPIRDPQPMVNWLNGLGEASYRHQTPDGYSLSEAAWSSSGQMSRRFEIARIIGADFSRLSSPLYRESMEPFLSSSTQAVLAQARSDSEWNALLLSSPEFAYE